MKLRLIVFLIFLTILSILIFYLCMSNGINDTILYGVKNNSLLIKDFSKTMNLGSRIFVSIIYGELKNNLNSLDELDNIRAQLGFDPSVGFAQMRVSTFLWIEDNYADGKIIKKSSSRDEMVNKLINDSTNILYSVFYIKLIHDKLLNKFHKEPSIKLLASYYGKGIDYYRENELDSSYYNQIGITAEEFYYSDKLLQEFPR